MCNHTNKRSGKSLKNKQAHAKDHLLHSRRNFLVNTGLMGATMMLPFKNNLLKASALNPFLAAVNQAETDRILVLVRLDGGNDGLNTIIPTGVTQQNYQENRKNLFIPEQNLSNTIIDHSNAFNPAFHHLMPMWKEGNMAAIHNVSYENASYSHFRATDIWATATEANTYENRGWLGRYIDAIMPAFSEAPPVVPVALEVGDVAELSFQGKYNSTSLSINSVEQFYSIAESGKLYNTDFLGSCNRDQEILFLREIANSSFYYKDAIQDAFDTSFSKSPVKAYPTTHLGERLHIISQMIKGGLSTKIYMVSLGSFDTHNNQTDRHTPLLNEYAEAIQAFQNDMQNYQLADKVLTFAFSEFGRTWTQNSSGGTDHGLGGPVFLHGGNINGGLYGEQPDINNIEENEDPAYQFDFKTIYAAILKNWLCINPQLANFVLNKDIAPFPNLIPNCKYAPTANNRAVLLGHQIHIGQPNIIEIQYAIKRDMRIQLELLNNYGQVIFILYEGNQTKGAHSHIFNKAENPIPKGNYFYRLKAGAEAHTKALKIFI